MAEREVHDSGVAEGGELDEAQGTASKAEKQKDNRVVAESIEATMAQEDEDEQSEDSADTAGKKSKADGREDIDNESDDEYGISMDKVEAVLNQSVDAKHMTPQMRRIVQRQAENSKRVEETIKGTKANPRWFVPLFVTLMLLGLAWIVVYYIAASMGHQSFPIPGIGQWNLLVGFAILLLGFLLTMGWR
ncbi:cell division protein CrgA [Bombiscardovia nodaiensis]|uniref:Cell division protein CrgA n=1 Tax=Bombiscardovia nodaiensis TaxID=2932181 RepID=A0ABM8B5N2_9BIFI|nr:cell division protein CrgA [Bombiscardovia nodaiensis]